jgi:hypothetical protein
MGRLARAVTRGTDHLMSDVDLITSDHCLPAMMPPSTGRMTPVMKLA